MEKLTLTERALLAHGYVWLNGAPKRSYSAWKTYFWVLKRLIRRLNREETNHKTNRV